MSASVPNKALHRTAIPLRSIAAGELGRYVSLSLTPLLTYSHARV